MSAEKHEIFRKNWERIKSKYCDEYNKGELARLEEMFEVLCGINSPKYLNLIQRPYSFYMPSLLAQPRWNKDQFELTKVLEQNYEIIQKEFKDLFDESVPEAENEIGFEEYIGDGTADDKGKMTSRGEWKVFYFFHNFRPNYDHLKKCPKTAEIFKDLIERGLMLGGMVCFSVIRPGTHIVPHTGPSNMRLTCHMGICGCKGARLRAGNEWVDFEEGKCFIFDDSFIHEVRHSGSELRASLMLDLWHPEMSLLERRCFMEILEKSMSSMDPDVFLHSMNIYKTKQFS